MAGRTDNQEGYRFGFNGKENDNEINGAGNSLDFGARIYDSRLGRFLSIDPMYSKSPNVSGYSTTYNSPIASVDFEGLYPIVTITNVEYSTTSSGMPKIKITLSVDVKYKVLNLTSKALDVSIDALNNKGQYIVNDRNATNEVYQLYKPNGQKYPTANGATKVVIDATIDVTYSYSMINSINDILPTDNVIIFGENVSDKGNKLDGITGTLVSIIDIKASDKLRTTYHEATHQLGVADAYQKSSNGPISKRSNNLMDLKGWNLDFDQIVDMASYMIGKYGESVAKGKKGVFIYPMDAKSEAIKMIKENSTSPVK